MIRTRDLPEISKLECVNLILNHSAIRAFKSWARFSILTVLSPGPIISSRSVTSVGLAPIQGYKGVIIRYSGPAQVEWLLST